MSSFKSSSTVQQIQQIIQSPLKDNFHYQNQRQNQKHYNTYTEKQNHIEQNNALRMSVQPYFQQTRSYIGNSQSNRINSADIRSSSQKRQSNLISNTLGLIDKKQTIILSSNSSNRLTQQPTQSTLYQQSTNASSSAQHQSNSTQSQQLPFSYPQMSQILSGSQITQSSLSRNSQQKHTNGQFIQKSQFLLNSKRKESDEISENEHKNCHDYQQFFKNQLKDAQISKDESIQLDLSKVSPYLDGVASSKRLNTVNNYEQNKFYYLKPAPLLKQPKNTDLPPVNLGDQQVSLEQESAITITTLQQSFMVDSSKIRERSLGSVNFDIKRTRLTKRLLDLQEPRNILEEEDEDIITTCQTDRKVEGNERSRSQIFEVQKNQELNQKKKKYSCEIKQIYPFELDIDFESEVKDENIEEFSPHQKPPSMASLNNQQLNRDWNNQKSQKDRRVSNATISVDYRSAQLSTNDTVQSFHYNLKPASISLHQPNEIVKKLQIQMENQHQNEELNVRKRRSSSTKQSDDVPDEPEKTQILRTFYLAGNRIPVVKLSQINKQNQQSCEKYFIPSLMKSLKGEKDKLSNLYKQYFQKMYYNLQVNPKLENKFHQISPVFLPPLTSNKKTIFFDLDETLIHCIDIFTDPQQYQEFTQSNMTNKNPSPFSRNVESCNETLCTIQCTPQEQIQCLFSIRPHAQQILQELSKDFELILLTAARKIYADAVLQKLDPENKIFSHKFYRECCIEFQIPNPLQNQGSKKSYLKDLRIFQNRKLENVILVDNSPLSYLNQVSNGIPILDYCNNNKNDEELLHLCTYLKTLINVTDVRESIKQKFFLKQYKAFQNIESLQQYILQEYSNSSTNQY
ncbi:NLI interacting factor-like phosphatase (macronuclear) [Tetrahymena thermophila SB210]|uniref:NLI interacting factor-like phosphatase n=1 Tax=Tetrahymena thermophila (strain SB210) TaxID=312017 RepID=I7LX28_TETTS|nr:NLI interacting factor-like phosphatase [Tetrahymena thermophila SB210]EAS03648.3 NLI interacting factor-like phosphatase [Tetrahymena thermophila SB210]|eukprot:XP_001023893.3 NLI interacting factor-like phosphatase [Tetrahymena thermophila SB210]